VFLIFDMKICKDLIVNRLYNKEEFVFTQGPYYLPTKLMSRRTGLAYSIRKSIKDHIDNEDKTGAVKSILELLDPWIEQQEGRKFDYVREMIFLVRDEDYPIWLELYPGENEERMNRNLFIADLFFPYLHLIVELDGLAFHEYLDPDKPKYDQARDQFLYSVYGLNTIRLTESPVEKRFEKLKRILRKQNEYDTPASLDYTDEIAKIYLNHTYPPECFEIIEKYILTLPNFFDQDKEEVQTEGYIKGLDTYFEPVNEILGDLYGKHLVYSDAI